LWGIQIEFDSIQWRILTGTRSFPIQETPNIPNNNIYSVRPKKKSKFALTVTFHEWLSRQKLQAPIRNRQTRKVANAKGLNRNTNLA